MQQAKALESGLARLETLTSQLTELNRAAQQRERSAGDAIAEQVRGFTADLAQRTREAFDGLRNGVDGLRNVVTTPSPSVSRVTTRRTLWPARRTHYGTRHSADSRRSTGEESYASVHSPPLSAPAPAGLITSTNTLADLLEMPPADEDARPHLSIAAMDAPAAARPSSAGRVRGVGDAKRGPRRRTAEQQQQQQAQDGDKGWCGGCFGGGGNNVVAPVRHASVAVVDVVSAADGGEHQQPEEQRMLL